MCEATCDAHAMPPCVCYTERQANVTQNAKRSVKIILPFFPVGTMERVDREGEIATAVRACPS